MSADASLAAVGRTKYLSFANARTAGPVKAVSATSTLDGMRSSKQGQAEKANHCCPDCITESLAISLGATFKESVALSVLSWSSHARLPLPTWTIKRGVIHHHLGPTTIVGILLPELNKRLVFDRTVPVVRVHSMCSGVNHRDVSIVSYVALLGMWIEKTSHEWFR